MLKKLALIVSIGFFLFFLPGTTFAACGGNEIFTPCDPDSPGNILRFTDEQMAQRITELSKRVYEMVTPKFEYGYEICTKYIGGPVDAGSGQPAQTPYCIFEWSNGPAGSSASSSAGSNPLAGDINSQIPELNPFCWHLKDCQAIRKQFGGTGTGTEGFISDLTTAPCNGGEGDSQWGRCLPAGTTKTEISFGGQNQFSNIGEFIVLMYKYLVTIASIVAVVVVIVAGMQWVTSGGNSEAISSAKKRIGGAIIGLFIAYMSYFVLNTINPALVNLRLPQVWLVKPVALMPEFCSDIPNPNGQIKFASVAAADNPRAPLLPSEQRKYVSPTENNFKFICGSRYLAENGGETTCFGDHCDKQNNQNYMCAKNDPSQGGYGCIAGDLLIHYFVNTTDFDIKEAVYTEAEKVPVVNWFISNAMFDEWLGSSAVVRAVCSIPSEDSYYLANFGKGQEWNSHIQTRHIPKAGYDEYVDVYSGLTDLSLIKNSFNCSKLTSGGIVEGEVVGYFIRQIVRADQSPGAQVGEALKGLVSFGNWGDVKPEPNLNIGYFNGAAQFGTFTDISGLMAFIPLDKLKERGLRLEVGLTLGKFKDIMGDKSSVPHE